MKELKEAQMGIIAVLALMLVSIKRRLPEARRLSSGIATLTLAGIVLLVAAGSASAANCGAGTGNACQCGDTVVGDWTFTGDMDCSDETLNGLTIGADGITIDGAGYSMAGDLVNATCTASQTSPCVIHSGVINTGGWDNVVVKNLEIKDFCTGVVIGTAGMGDTEENMTVTGCNIHDCGESLSVTHGIHLVGANYCTITKNEIHHIEGQGIPGACGGGGNGIFMHGDTAQMTGIYGDYNNITCNYLHHNKKSGFFMKFQCMYCNISYNKATNNTQSGIMPKCEQSNHNMMEYNNMSNNGVNGLYCGGNNNTIRHNTVLNNGAAGIEFKAATGVDNTVEHNFVCGHTTDILLGTSTNSGDNNTCGTGPAGWCDWSCGNEVAVYYDFDKDGQCSKKWDDCPCALPGTGSKCACCNPGLFDGSSSATTAYENSCNRDCQWTPGPDPNDCDFDITGTVKPDLIVVDKSETWFNETYYYVSYRVQNIGNATSNESEACVYINAVHQAGSDETIGELAPNEYSPVKTVGPFGPCTDPEDTIKVCADCTSTNDEWDETNNCTENVWAANQPDLTITEKHETWIDEVAGTYTITYTICNIGTATASASKTKVMIDGNATGSPDNVPELAPNECLTRTLSGPYTVTDGYDIIKLCADGPDSISESDETNNCIENTLYMSDLTIYVDPLHTDVTPQDQFDINIRVDPAGREIYGVEYYLTYNTSIVRAESQVKGPFLGTSSDTIVVVNDIDRTNGKVSYAETRRESGGVTDKDISSVIQFTAIGPADNCTGLNLSGVIIVKADKTTVIYIIENGTVCITNNQPPVASGCSKHRINNVQKKFECLAQLCSNSYDDDGDKTDGGGDIVYIRWAFGDGEYGTSEGLGECPCKYHSYISWIWEPFGVSYDTGGRYVPFNVSLTVTDNGDPQLEDETKFNVTVYMAGDTNGDGVVNIIDAVYIGLSWGETCNTSATYCQPLWDDEQWDAADLNNDCEVNILDAVIVGTMWGHEAYYPV